jgi:hypothetical protein
VHDGRFRITGLAPGPYTLQLESGDGRELVVPFPALEVIAPAEGVRIGPTYGCTRVRVTAAGAAPARATLRVHLERGMLSRSVEVGAETLVVADLRAPLQLSAEAVGFPFARAELPADARARVDALELRLAADEAAGALELTWTIDVESLAPAWVTAQWWCEADGTQGEASVQATTSGCRFDNWKPGRYRVVLEPREKDPWELTTSYLCTPTLVVDIAPGRTMRRDVGWVEGGRARIVPEPLPDEHRSSLTARVRDARGAELPVRFVQREYVEGALTISAFTGALALHGASELLPNLAPGTYELALDEGEPTALRLGFEIRAGETMDVALRVP